MFFAKDIDRLEHIVRQQCQAGTQRAKIYHKLLGKCHEHLEDFGTKDTCPEVEVYLEF